MEFKINRISDYKEISVFSHPNELHLGVLNNDEVEQLSITLLTTAYKLMKNSNLSHEELMEWIFGVLS